MESKNRKVIIIALILALFTSFMIYIYLKKTDVKPEVKIDYISVCVAAKTIPARHKVNDSDIKIVKVTRDYLNSQAVLDKGEIVGKRIKDRIIAGEQILRDRLVDENKATLNFFIPTGKRAVSININEQTAVADLLRPGD